MAHLAVGAWSGAHRRPVAASQARAFALAIDDENPSYMSGACVPPLFGTVVGGYAIVELYRILFPKYPDVNVVHLASDTRFVRPLVLENDVVAQAWVTGIQPTARGAMVYLLNTLEDVAGALLFESHATIFLPGYHGQSEVGVVPPEPPSADLRRAQTLAQRTVTIAHDRPLRYAAASGDWQRIHFDDDAAQSIGLRSRVLHGGCTMAFCGAAVTDLVGNGDPTKLARFALRFARPVYPDSRIAIEVSEGVLVEDVWCHAVRATSNGQPVIRNGRAEVRR